MLFEVLTVKFDRFYAFHRFTVGSEAKWISQPQSLVQGGEAVLQARVPLSLQARFFSPELSEAIELHHKTASELIQGRTSGVK
jgi:hypothetical protein